MEFPDLGQQCLVQSCNKLDFLPIKCDSCSNVFCGDHFKYDSHDCPGGLKDNQVPVCPLCSAVIPVPKGTLPDLVVGQHIDNDCKDVRAGQSKRKITNKCNVKGCKQRELIPVLCSDCKRNYCLRHRHFNDHECDPKAARADALETLAKSHVSGGNVSKSFGSKITNYFKPSGIRSSPASEPSNRVVNDDLESDEALARALHESMNGSAMPSSSTGPNLGHLLSSVLPSTKSSTPKVPESREEEDEQLARAIANSEREVQRNKDKCLIS